MLCKINIKGKEYVTYPIFKSFKEDIINGYVSYVQVSDTYTYLNY